MEKKPNTKLLPVKMALFIFFTMGILSCNNNANNENGTTGNDTSQTTNQDTSNTTPAIAASNLDEFPVLYADFQDVIDIFEEPTLGNRKKIVFRYVFDGNQADGQPTLHGFSVKANGKFAKKTQEIQLSRSTTVQPIPLHYPLYLSNIELTSAEYNTLKNDANRLQYLVLIPKKSTKANQTDVVVYYTAWSSVTTFTMKDLKLSSITTAGDELNPSPPRDPV